MSVIEIQRQVQSLDLPDKMDIIPIHTSDRALFKYCRRKWDWSSPIRRNLMSKTELTGVYFPLWFGTGIHYSLEAKYDPVLQRDPVEAFIYWYTLVWEGGIIREDELRLSYDRKPRKTGNTTVNAGTGDNSQGLYEVQGLRDLHPDPDPSEFELHRELGIGMMEYYKTWSEANDEEYRVIATEHDFSVPLDMEAVDPRDGKVKEVYYCGRQDKIIQHIESEKYGIEDYKTAASLGEEYFRKTEKDEQCTSYLWAGENEAAVYDLPYTSMDFVLYTGLWKNFPRPPTITTKGVPSLDRQKESCTAEMFLQAISDNNLQVWLDGTEKAQAYLSYLQQPEDRYIQRKLVTRNKHEIESAGERIRMEVADMLGVDTGWVNEGSAEYRELPRIYPNITGDRWCLNCPFRIPCIATDDGSDAEALLEENYEQNKMR